MDSQKVQDASLFFLRHGFQGTDLSNIKGLCDSLEEGYADGSAKETDLVETIISTLSTVEPDDFVPETHKPHAAETPIDVVGSQTHGVICINLNIYSADGRLDMDRIDTSFTLGGDPMMTMFLLNLLGHNTALSTLIGNDRYGSLYAAGIEASGINLIRTDRESCQPLQINIQVDGNRAGSICLHDKEPLDYSRLLRKYRDFTVFVSRHPGMKYALIGGAPAGDEEACNRTYFAHEIEFCKTFGIRTGGEPKDKLQGDGLRTLLAADDFKPNEGELYLVEGCVLKGEPYTRQLKKLARREGRKYQEDPGLASRLYRALAERGIVNVWIPTLGHAGALLLSTEADYRLEVPDMTEQAAMAGGSMQGCGNGAWAGYIDAYLRYGFDPGMLLTGLGAGGMASCLHPGNLGGTAAEMAAKITAVQITKHTS